MKEKKDLPESSEEYRALAKEHIDELKDIWGSFLLSGVIVLAIVAVIIAAALGWFVLNTSVNSINSNVSVNENREFSLATVGTKSSGVYDGLFSIPESMTTETIGGNTYYIASSGSSFRVDSNKNFNNYFDNADLRPGNRGSFDIYVICRTENREMILNPVFRAWAENIAPESNNDKYYDAFMSTASDNAAAAAEFLKGHILLFSDIDSKGMYSGFIDFTKKINIRFLENGAVFSQGDTESSESQTEAASIWGDRVYADAVSSTAVYRLPIYWVWPEQFGNFIYTGNSYNKNLFSSTESNDYKKFLALMQSSGTNDYKKFFYIEEDENNPVNRPDIKEKILDNTSYQEATENYEMYSGWYNAADEKIGEYIAYFELGFEIAEG